MRIEINSIINNHIIEAATPSKHESRKGIIIYLKFLAIADSATFFFLCLNPGRSMALRSATGNKNKKEKEKKNRYYLKERFTAKGN